MLCWPSELPAECSPRERGSGDRHTIRCIAQAEMGAGCSGRDPESCKRHCMVFDSTVLAARLREANRVLKVALRELIS